MRKAASHGYVGGCGVGSAAVLLSTEDGPLACAGRSTEVIS